MKRNRRLYRLEKVAEEIWNIRERYYYDTLNPLYNKNKARYKAVYMRQKILIESVLKGGLLNSKKIWWGRWDLMGLTGLIISDWIARVW